MQIIDVTNEPEFIARVAAALRDGFATSGVAPWADAAEAVAEVEESLEDGRISRAAVGEDGEILGWIAGFHQYARVWELHPLVVRAAAQGRGVGRALVADFEREVRRRGGLTITLGTDDENGRTSLGGVDLYPDALGKLARIENLRRHPFEFYRRLGFEVTGVVPDANGFGKPDILMCKRV